MTVEPSELRAIIGPNGAAGNTTFFKLVARQYLESACRMRSTVRSIARPRADEMIE
jgi:ABC-type branched-subunit amino acid transport system ATPase component